MMKRRFAKAYKHQIVNRARTAEKLSLASTPHDAEDRLSSHTIGTTRAIPKLSN